MSEELAKVGTDNAVQLLNNTTDIGSWMNPETFNHMARVSSTLAKSNLVPQNYQNKPEDCLIAFDMANRMGVNPLMVMQNLYVVKGKPAWSGQACMALINASGRFVNVKHNYFGKEGADERGCFVSADRADTGEHIEGVKVTLAMAKAEGWTSNAKWRNMPELMLAYRSAAFFARVYCPDMLMGCQTTDEVDDVRRTPANLELTKQLDAAMQGGGDVL